MTRDKEINALVEQRDFSTAQAVATEWTRAAPRDSTAWTRLAFTLKLQRSYDAAAKAAQTAIELAPAEPGLWMDLGMIRYLKHDFDHAAEAFGHALVAGEALNAVYYEDAATLCRSIALLKANHVDEADRALAKVTSEDAEMWLDKHFTLADVRAEIQRRMLLGVAKSNHIKRKPGNDH